MFWKASVSRQMSPSPGKGDGELMTPGQEARAGDGAKEKKNVLPPKWRGRRPPLGTSDGKPLWRDTPLQQCKIIRVAARYFLFLTLRGACRPGPQRSQAELLTQEGETPPPQPRAATWLLNWFEKWQLDPSSCCSRSGSGAGRRMTAWPARALGLLSHRLSVPSPSSLFLGPPPPNLPQSLVM